MPRRVSLPGAAELFRPTRGDAVEDAVGEPPVEEIDGTSADATPATSPATTPATSAAAGSDPTDEATGRRGTGRVRHDEKITVYVSTDELIALEQTRLRLRAEHDTAVDRGRIVREAVSMALEDFATSGSDSPLVRRLTRS